MRKRSHISGSHVGRILMWSCGAELCLPRDTSSLARQGDRRLAQHRRAPLLHYSFPAQTLEALRKHSRLASTPLAALLFTFWSHQLLFTTPMQPRQDPTLVEGLTARLPQHPQVQSNTAPSSLLLQGRGSLGPWLAGDTGLPPRTHPESTLSFSFLQVKVF